LSPDREASAEDAAATIVQRAMTSKIPTVARAGTLSLLCCSLVVTAACGESALDFPVDEVLLGRPLPPGIEDIPNPVTPEIAPDCDGVAPPGLPLALHPHRLHGETNAALRITFVSEGFLEEDEAIYWEHRNWLVEHLQRDERGVVGQLFAHLRFDGVFVPSATRAVFDDAQGNTAFGTCLLAPGARAPHSTSLRLSTHPEAKTRLLDAFPKAPHVVVMLINASDGRANAAHPSGDNELVALDEEFTTSQPVTRTIHMHRLDAPKVLDHELAHSLLHLGDEYSENDVCFEAHMPAATTRPPLHRTPNLDLDPTGTKWASVFRGAHEGGDQFGSCVFHPSNDCRMLSSDSEHYCPVCEHEIRELANALARDAQDGFPDCNLSANGFSSGDTLSSVFVDVDAHDNNLPIRVSLFVDGERVAEGSASEDFWFDAGYVLEPHTESITLQAFCTDGLGRRSEAQLKVSADDFR